MNNRRPPVPVIIVILLALIIGGYYGFRSLNADNNSLLKASGSIESPIVNVSPEMAGKVKEVIVEEGQSVMTGAPLLRLDDSLLQSEKQTAQAALDSAKASVETAQVALESIQLQYDLTVSNALAQEQSSRISIWKDSKPVEFNQPVWYFSKEERVKAAQSQVDVALQALQDAQRKLDETEGKAGGSQFVAIEAKLVEARAAFENAKTVFDRTNGVSDSQSLRDAAQIVLDETKIDLDNAQKDYDDELTTDGAKDVLNARAVVIVAREIHSTAVDELRALQTGMDSPLVQNADKAVEQAKAMLHQAQTNVASAQTRLDLIGTQMDKLTIYAPMDGVILVRNVEHGEFVQPGAVTFTMANLNELTITVYVPEDQYGNISLGQQAVVNVDSFVGETFTAEVIHIADQAEFTPRNVQTVEGRSSTVIAIKLKVTDTAGKLKIGMPADVVFK